MATICSVRAAYLQRWSRIINGVAPANIIFGGAINLDRDILSPNTMPEEHEHGDLSKYVADLILTQRAVIEIAKANQTAKDDAHMTTSNEEEEEEENICLFY